MANGGTGVDPTPSPPIDTTLKDSERLTSFELASLCTGHWCRGHNWLITSVGQGIFTDHTRVEPSALRQRGYKIKGC
jgi:hypothetical protein